MRPVWALNAETFKHGKDKILATRPILRSSAGETRQDFDFFLIRVRGAYFDSNVFR